VPSPSKNPASLVFAKKTITGGVGNFYRSLAQCCEAEPPETLIFYWTEAGAKGRLQLHLSIPAPVNLGLLYFSLQTLLNYW